MNEHSAKFDTVKSYFKSGLWGIKKVHDAVGKWITEAEYKEITGMNY